jgi:hypothetical protein
VLAPQKPQSAADSPAMTHHSIAFFRAFVVKSRDSIDGIRDNPRYAAPKRANPSRNARLLSVRWMASKTEIVPSVSVLFSLIQESFRDDLI